MKTTRFLTPVIISVLILSACNQSKDTMGWEYVDEILKEINPPEFPDADFIITDYGAIGDSITDCSDAFQQAITACHAAGGGRVVVPAGIYLTGAIHLKSNVNLHVTDSATILFIRDYSKYLPVVVTRFEGNELMNYAPPIYAYEQENIAITGKGTLNGNADTCFWWPWAGSRRHGWTPDMLEEDEADKKLLKKMSDERISVEKRIFGEGHYLRVNFIQPYLCKNILIEGVKIVRSPMWEIHPVLCENITVRDVTIISHGPNNDGCDPECCKNVLIENCYFDTGDDCIAIKSGREEDGRRVGKASENIIIRGCTMKDGHGGVVIGSEISGGCRNVFAEDCNMDSPNLDRALRIKSNALRGGVVENIFMRNIQVGEVADAVVRIYFYYAEGDTGIHTPIVRNIMVENVTSEKSKYPLYLWGYKRSPIRNVTIRNCTFNNNTADNLLKNVSELNFENFTVNGEILSSPGTVLTDDAPPKRKRRKPQTVKPEV